MFIRYVLYSRHCCGGWRYNSKLNRVLTFYKGEKDNKQIKSTINGGKCCETVRLGEALGEEAR